MQGNLARGELVRLAYRLGRGQATGGLTIMESGGARHLLHLRRGYLTSSRLEGPSAPLGEILVEAGAIDRDQLRRSIASAATRGGSTLQGRALVAGGLASEAEIDAALRRQAELRLERLAAIPSGTYAFDPQAPPPPPGAGGGRPVALTAWARRHAEARLDAVRARALAGELSGARLALRKHLAPDPAECDDTDRRILAALATPRRLDEIEQSSRAPRFRLLAFLHFLQAVGALELAGVAATPPARRPDPLAAARRLLGVDDHADGEAVKRAYRRLARELHPDAHPDASDATRHGFATRFAAVSEAYRALSR